MNQWNKQAINLESKFFHDDGVVTWDIRSALSCWVDKGAKTDITLHPLQPPALELWLRWLILPAAQSLDFCLVPVQLSPRDAASEAIVSSAGTRSSSSYLD